jgi:hypothetical protein
MRIQFVKEYIKKSGKPIKVGTIVECTKEKAQYYIDGGYATKAGDWVPPFLRGNNGMMSVKDKETGIPMRMREY